MVHRHPLRREDIAELETTFVNIPHLKNCVRQMWLMEQRGELNYLPLGPLVLGTPPEKAKTTFTWRFWRQRGWSFWRRPELPTESLRRLAVDIIYMPTEHQEAIDRIAGMAEAWLLNVLKEPPPEIKFAIVPQYLLRYQPKGSAEMNGAKSPTGAFAQLLGSPDSTAALPN